MKISAIAPIRAKQSLSENQKVAFGETCSNDTQREKQIKNAIEELVHSKYCEITMNDYYDKRYTPESYISPKDAFNSAVKQVRGRVLTLFNQTVKNYKKNHPDTKNTNEGRWS